MHKKIHKLIKSNNIKQREIAKKMGITESTLRMYLLGNRRITVSMLYKLNDALCTIADENMGKSVVLKQELQKLLMDMSSRDSIGDM